MAISASRGNLTRSRRAATERQLADFGRSVSYCIAGLPIAIRAGLKRVDDDPELIVRKAYSRRYLHPRTSAEILQLALGVLISPFAVLGITFVFICRDGRTVAKAFGRPVHRQLFDQLRLYVTAGVLAPWYYIFELHRHPQGRFAREFIYRWESKGGVLRLLKEGSRKPTSELSDKARFAEECCRRQIRTVPVLAVFRGGEVELLTSDRELAVDLFVKPICGRGGKGAERWDYCAGIYRSPAGGELTREMLFSRLKERSRQVDLLVQPMLRNHPALDGLNNTALSTVRVLTCLDERNEPELIGAAARMPIGHNRTVDNLHAGGIAAVVDLETGKLGPASNLGADASLGWMDRHPDSGAAIRGTTLPMWDELRDFAVRTHKGFGDRIVVGWDIAITRDGLVLVEGNGSPDLDIMQRFARQGLMASRLGELLAFHLSQTTPADGLTAAGTGFAKPG